MFYIFDLTLYNLCALKTDFLQTCILSLDDIFYSMFIIFRFVPYIGIVTILMNDYPKLKVSSLSLL